MKFIIVLFLSLMLPINSFAGCTAVKSEVKAFDLMALQSSIMVAALSCNQQGDYNKLIKKHQFLFNNGGKELKGYFKRIYGSDYESELNKFITNLANLAAKSSMNNDSDLYCEQTADTFKTLFSLGEKKLKKFAEQKSYTSLHGIKFCS
jgi:hypothetical protein